jgi:dCMP deaminase
MSKKRVWADIATRLAEESKCVSHSVACVIVKDNHIISTGVNGSQSGHPNCCEVFIKYNKETDREAHHRWSNIHEVHAEKNALRWIDRSQSEGSTCYVTIEPCLNCLKDMIAAGVKEVYFKDYYDKNEYREEMIAEAVRAGVIFERF